MMTCKQVAHLLMTGELERAGRWRRFQVRLHLWMCNRCARLERQLKLMRRAGRSLSRAAGNEQPAGGKESLEARILRTLGGGR